MWKTGSDLEGLVLLASSPSLQIASKPVCPVVANTRTPSVYIYRLGDQLTSSAEAA